MQSNVIRILSLIKVLQEHTDEKHPMTREEITDLLNEQGITYNRKTFYEYIKQLQTAGYPVVANKSGEYGYYMASQPFSFAQAKLLVDAVQTSKVLASDMSSALISRIASTMSQYESSQLQRKLYMSERPKTFNKKIYQHIDIIHDAISNHRKLSFRYFDWALNHNNEKVKRYRHDGLEYTISPYSLVWAEDNYYCVGHYPKHQGLTNFRVDKMDLVLKKDEKRVSLSEATGQSDFNLALYSQRLFSMFVGETVEITMHVDESLLGVMIDRFGQHVQLKRIPHAIEVVVSVEVSPPFLAWVFQFKDNIKIVAPSSLVKEFKDYTQDVLNQYKGV